MRVYVLVLMSGDRCRSLRPCIALIAAVVGTIVICLLNLIALPQYTVVEYHDVTVTGESHSYCFVERASSFYRYTYDCVIFTPVAAMPAVCFAARA